MSSGKLKSTFADRPQQRVQVPSGQIRSAYGSREQGIADKQGRSGPQVPGSWCRRSPPGIPRRGNGRACGARAISYFPNSELLIPGVEMIDLRLRLYAQTEHQSLLHHRFIQKVVVLVQPDRHAERPFSRRDSGDMVQMRVREENLLRRPADAASERPAASLDLVARIDDDRFACLLASERRIHS